MDNIQEYINLISENYASLDDAATSADLDTLVDPSDPHMISYFRVANLFTENPNNPNYSKIQIAIRRLITNEHITIEYRELLNDLFRQIVEILMADPALLNRVKSAFKSKY